MREENILNAAKIMADKLHPMYKYINLDSGWSDDSIDSYGRFHESKDKFPSGIKNTINIVHDLGLKFGIYFISGVPKNAWDANSPIKGTNYTIRDIVTNRSAQANAFKDSRYKIDYSIPGSQEYINSQVKLLAEWGVDFIKLDGIVPGSQVESGVDCRDDVKAWSNAIKESGRSIWLTLSWKIPLGYISDYQSYANAWRIEQDVESYDTVLTNWGNIRRNARQAHIWASNNVHSQGYQDMDSLLIGNGKMSNLTEGERRAMISIWAMAGGPLYSGDDLTKLDDYGLYLLTNKEVISIQQKSNPAKVVKTLNDVQVWCANNKDGTIVVGVVNWGNVDSNVTFDSKQISSSDHTYGVRDLIEKNNLIDFKNIYNVFIQSHDAKLLLLSKK
ncbi:alpha-galactosidase [Acrasis kona]|uniref:Alpha-galactosidase n=1 Tax=Acrasis kona TaxID=1008807 RepID=A0AAW2Z9Q2_9EUKA